MAEEQRPADRFRSHRGNPFFDAGTDAPPAAPNVHPHIFGKDMPQGYAMIGALAGANVGARAGPWGLAVGGLLGTGVGYFMGESTLDGVGWLQALGFMGRDKITIPPRPSIKTRTLGAIEESVIDTGASVLTPVFPLIIRGGKWVVKKLLGVGGEAAQQVAAKAHGFGVELSAVDISDSRILSFFPKVLGRWPLISGSFRTRARAHGQEILAAKDRMFLSLGPSANMADMGIDISRAIDKRFANFLSTINDRYAAALKVAKEANATVDTRHIYDVATTIDARYHARLARRTGYGPDLKAYEAHPIVKMLHDQTHLPVPSKSGKSVVLANLLGPRASMQQYEALADVVDKKLASKNLDVFDREQLSALKAAIERALLTIDDAASGQMFRETDDLYGKMMSEVWGTPTAKKVASIQRGRFRIGGEVKLDRADTSFNTFLDMESPTGMRDLRRLIGGERFDRTVSVYLQNSFDRALKSGEEAVRQGGGTSGLDVGMLRREWGLDSATNPRRKALQAALDNSAIPHARLEEFVEVIETTLKNAAPDVNSFVARGMVLGGIGRLRGLLVPGSSAAAGGLAGGEMGAVTAISLVAAFRGFASIISSPRLFRATKIALDDTISLQRRRMAALAVIEATEAKVDERSQKPANGGVQ